MAVKAELQLGCMVLVLALTGCAKKAGEATAPAADSYAAPPPAGGDPLGELDQLEAQMRQLGLRPGKGKRRSKAERHEANRDQSKDKQNQAASAGAAQGGETRADETRKDGSGGEGEADDIGRNGDGDWAGADAEEMAPGEAPAPESAHESVALSEDGGEIDQCQSICALSQAICDLEVRICTMADEHEGDSTYADACERAIDDCELASEACEDCY